MRKINFEKLKNQLKEVQRGCSARTMDLQDVKNFIQTLERERETILKMPVEKKYLKKIYGYKEYAVPISYNYKTETTGISGYITKYGRIVINVYRGQASKIPYGGIREKITAVYE